MRSGWLAVVCLSVGCASVPIRKPDLAPLAVADAKVLQGCYDCLIEARATYAWVAAGKARPLVVQRLFETDLLIAARENEFGLPSSAALEQARTLAAELAPSIEAGRYVAAVESLPPEHGSTTHAEYLEFRRAHSAFQTIVNGEITWIAGGALALPVRQYLALALDCAYPSRRLGRPVVAVPDVPVPAADAPPLVRYRAAECAGIDVDAFTRVRTEVPRFVEAAYFLGDIAMRTLAEGGGEDPRPLVAEAQTRFPQSNVVTMLAARLQEMIGHCDLALPLYDRILESKPEHEDAWLGRTVCFTGLNQSQDAIGAATHMIDRKFDNLDQALYWRAWNHHRQTELDLARADIETVRHMHVSPAIYTLAGVIEHDQNDLGPAERDLTLARATPGNCVAMWYLGSVYVRRERSEDAAVTFDAARDCYGGEAARKEAGLASVARNDTLDVEYKRQQMAGLQRDIDTARRSERASSLNAAKFYAVLRDFAKVPPLLDLAALEPAFAADVTELRKWIADNAPRAAGQ